MTKKPAKPEQSAPPTKGEGTVLPMPEDGIGRRIRQLRSEREWTQAVLSNRTKLADPNGEGISRTVLSGYENGEYRPGAREIRVLCSTFQISPNWLIYGRDEPFEVSLPSMEALASRAAHGGRSTTELSTAVKAALAMLVLEGHERDALYSLALSFAGRQLGDLRLSSLLTLAGGLADDIVAIFQEQFKEHFAEGVSTQAALTAIVDELSRSMMSNLGNKLKYPMPDDPRYETHPDEVTGEWLYPDPEDSQSRKSGPPPSEARGTKK